MMALDNDGFSIALPIRSQNFLIRLRVFTPDEASLERLEQFMKGGSFNSPQEAQQAARSLLRALEVPGYNRFSGDHGFEAMAANIRGGITEDVAKEAKQLESEIAKALAARALSLDGKFLSFAMPVNEKPAIQAPTKGLQMKKLTTMAVAFLDGVREELREDGSEPALKSARLIGRLIGDDLEQGGAGFKDPGAARDQLRALYRALKPEAAAGKGKIKSPSLPEMALIKAVEKMGDEAMAHAVAEELSAKASHQGIALERSERRIG